MNVDLHTHDAYYSDQILMRLRAELKTVGSQKELAKRIGISPQFLHDMLNDRRAITGRALEYLGFAEITVYYRIDGWR